MKSEENEGADGDVDNADRLGLTRRGRYTINGELVVVMEEIDPREWGSF